MQSMELDARYPDVFTPAETPPSRVLTLVLKPELAPELEKSTHKVEHSNRQNHPPPNILTTNKTIRMLTFLAVKTTHLAITGAPGAVQPPLRRLTQRILTFLGS